MRPERLPAGLAEPLHLLEPWPWGKLLAVAFLSLLLAFLIWRRRRRAARELTAATLTPPPAPGPPGLDGAVAALRDRYGAGGDFRRGCHELAALVRGHLESLRGLPYSVLTAGEIQRAEGDTRLSRLFALLAELQFGRRAPDAGDFEGACDLVLEVTGRS